MTNVVRPLEDADAGRSAAARGADGARWEVARSTGPKWSNHDPTAGVAPTATVVPGIQPDAPSTVVQRPAKFRLACSSGLWEMSKEVDRVTTVAPGGPSVTS